MGCVEFERKVSRGLAWWGGKSGAANAEDAKDAKVRKERMADTFSATPLIAMRLR
jgi:hypothetical protein